MRLSATASQTGARGGRRGRRGRPGKATLTTPRAGHLLSPARPGPFSRSAPEGARGRLVPGASGRRVLAPSAGARASGLGNPEPPHGAALAVPALSTAAPVPATERGAGLRGHAARHFRPAARTRAPPPRSLRVVRRSACAGATPAFRGPPASEWSEDGLGGVNKAPPVLVRSSEWRPRRRLRAAGPASLADAGGEGSRRRRRGVGAGPAVRGSRFTVRGSRLAARGRPRSSLCLPCGSARPVRRREPPWACCGLSHTSLRRHRSAASGGGRGLGRLRSAPRCGGRSAVLPSPPPSSARGPLGAFLGDTSEDEAFALLSAHGLRPVLLLLPVGEREHLGMQLTVI